MAQRNVRRRNQSVRTTTYSQSGHSQTGERHPSGQHRRGSESVRQRENTQMRQRRTSVPAQKKRRRKRRRRRFNWKWLIFVLCIAALLGGLGYLETIIFQTKQIAVTGNVHTPEQDILDWMGSDKYAGNSLYVLWRYNREDVQLPPSVQSVRVTLKSPGKVQVQVKEKTLAGRIDYDGAFLYFDKDGTASLKSDDVIDGVTYIEGMEINAEKVKMGKKIPAADDKIFGQITELTALLRKNSLIPDRLTCSGSNLAVTFGAVQVMLGVGNYEEKIAQVPPVLQKLSEQYAGQAGVLHLENYQTSDTSIRFVPDTQ